MENSGFEPNASKKLLPIEMNTWIRLPSPIRNMLVPYYRIRISQNRKTILKVPN
jgi:hypothetical protein